MPVTYEDILPVHYERLEAIAAGLGDGWQASWSCAHGRGAALTHDGASSRRSASPAGGR